MTDFISEGTDEQNVTTPKDVDFNAGIGVVIPIEQILETLNQDSLRDARLATLKAGQITSGYRDTSK